MSDLADPFGAFCDHDPVHLMGAAHGPLAGLTFAAKDLFDVAGARTCAGNPDWLESHGPAEATAPAIGRLVAAGATLVGKARTDELAYSITGVNAHYGTPRNPAVRGGIPGGSSSGSAVAVAAGLVDVALGTDTGGSVRVPASLCGIWGLRPTHGAIPLDRTFALAPSFDTVGTFARAPDLLARLDEVLRVGAPPPPRPGRLLVAQDAFALADPEVAEAALGALSALERDLPREDTTLAGSDGALGTWAEVFRVLQAREMWTIHAAWVRERRPSFGPGVAERVAAASRVGDPEVAAALEHRAALVAQLAQRVGDHVVALPTTPTTAPSADASPEELDAWRARTMALTAAAHLSGRPQLSIPVTVASGRPAGLSLLGPPHSEPALVELGTRLAGAIG